jgi:hypothetical protein
MSPADRLLGLVAVSASAWVVLGALVWTGFPVGVAILLWLLACLACLMIAEGE